MRGWLNLHALLLLHILKFVQYFCLTVMQSSAGQLPDTKTRPYCEPLSGPCEWSICAGSSDWPKCKTMVMPTSIQGPHSHTQACSGPWQDGIRGSEGPVNLPSFPRDSSSFWIWFSRKNMATANASSARSCNLGGIMTLSSPIKSSRERWWSVHAQRKRRRRRKHTHSSDDGGYKAAESVCMALSLSQSLPLRVCGYLPAFRSCGYLKRDVFKLGLVISFC